MRQLSIISHDSNTTAPSKVTTSRLLDQHSSDEITGVEEENVTSLASRKTEGFTIEVANAIPSDDEQRTRQANSPLANVECSTCDNTASTSSLKISAPTSSTATPDNTNFKIRI